MPVSFPPSPRQALLTVTVPKTVTAIGKNAFGAASAAQCCSHVGKLWHRQSATARFAYFVPDGKPLCQPGELLDEATGACRKVCAKSGGRSLTAGTPCVTVDISGKCADVQKQIEGDTARHDEPKATGASWLRDTGAVVLLVAALVVGLVIVSVLVMKNRVRRNEGGDSYDQARVVAARCGILMFAYGNVD